MRHHTVLGTWLHALKLLLQTAKTIISFAVFCSFILMSLNELGHPWLTHTIGELNLSAPFTSHSFQYAVLYYFIFILLETWSLIIMLLYLYAWLRERPIQLRRVIVRSMVYLPNMLWGLFIYDFLIELPHLLALFVPVALAQQKVLWISQLFGYWLGLLFVFFPFALLFKGNKLISAYRFSVQLISGRFFYVLFSLGVPFILLTLPFLFVYNLAQWFGVSHVMGLHFIFYAVILPFMMSLYLLVGYDLIQEKGLELHPDYLLE
jgi:hypothetical protein